MGYNTPNLASNSLKLSINTNQEKLNSPFGEDHQKQHQHKTNPNIFPQYPFKKASLKPCMAKTGIGIEYSG